MSVWTCTAESHATDGTKLNISGDYHLRGGDWEECGNVIGNNTNLKELRLGHLWDYHGAITRERLVPLWKGVAKNRSIQKLVLDRYHLFGAKVFFDIMCPFFEQNGNLRELEIYSITNDIDDKGAKSLGKCLERNKSLTLLKIHNNTKIKKGWGSIFSFLQSPQCRLTHLSLFENRIDDHAATFFANTLAKNTSVKILDLGKNNCIKHAGWIAIFRVLQGPNCILENLRLHHNRLDNSTVASLATSLDSNHTLKTLSLRSNNGWINHDWYKAFSFLLQSPNSVLEELDLSCISIEDKTVAALANSLTGNKKLKRLLIGDAISNIGNEAISALSHVVCNKTSIMATYQSNHTLQKVTGHLSHYKIQPYLDLNRKNCVNDARRRKIIGTHFSVHNHGGDINVQPFVDVDLEVLPHAIAWMAQDFHGFNLLNDFLPVMFSFLGDDWTHLGGDVSYSSSSSGGNL